jgi:hypothetical protein
MPQDVPFNGIIPNLDIPAGPAGPQGPSGADGVTPDLSDIYARLDALEAAQPAPGPDPTPDPDPGGDPYDLGAMPSFMSGLSWPAAPTPTNTVNVNSDADWTMEDNTRYVVADGNYSGKTITCNNCEFVLDDNAVINGHLHFSGNVIRWVGGKKVGHGSVGTTSAFTNDLLIDNLHAITESAESNSFSGANGWRRMAIINTTLDMQHNSGRDDWGIYVQREFPVGSVPYRGHDFILANVKVLSDSQNFRINTIENLVIVDSAFNPDGRSMNGWRIHKGVRNLYVRDTISAGPGSANDDMVNVTNGLVERLSRYAPSPAGAFYAVALATENMTINDSQTYIENNWRDDTPPLHGASGSNPNMLPWNGLTLPDHSGYGADH